MSRVQRKRKPVTKYVSETDLRQRATSPTRKAKRFVKRFATKVAAKKRPLLKKCTSEASKCPLKSVKKKKSTILTDFFKPSSTQRPTVLPKVLPKVRSQIVRRLRSTAPIYRIMDEIETRHADVVTEINPNNYICICGKVFETTSYRTSNFQQHIAKQHKTTLSFGKNANPWTKSRDLGGATTKSVLRQPKLNPSVVCDGFWHRSVDGVNITDRYHVCCGGKNGFYGMPNYRSHHGDVELRGTFKSVMCLKTGDI